MYRHRPFHLTRLGRAELLLLLLPSLMCCSTEAPAEAPPSVADSQAADVPTPAPDNTTPPDAPSCAPPLSTDSAPPSSLSPGFVATRVVPATVAPGEVLSVSVAITGVSEAKPIIHLAGESVSPVSLAPWEDGVLGCVAFTAPDAPGDHPIRVTGQSENGSLAGHALLHVRAAGSCKEDELYDGGECTPLRSGPSITVERALVIAGEAPVSSTEEVLMVHPRESWLYGERVVGCHTHRLYVAQTTSMRAVEPGLGTEGDGQPIYQLTPLTGSGLNACEGLRLDRTRQLAVTSSRGDDGHPGGIATWRLPPPTGSAPFAPEFSASLVEDAGMEGLAWSGDYLLTVQKPNQLRVLHIGGQGHITPIGSRVFPTMGSGSDVAVHGNVAYVTDGGAFTHDHGNGVLHPHGGGLLFLVDLEDLEHPTLLAQIETPGAAQKVAVLPDDVVAVADGSAGITLFDVSDPRAPTLLGTWDTPGSVNGLSFSEGHLLATDWDAFRLYDASERGRLRLLDAADLSGRELFEGSTREGGGLRAVNDVTLAEGQFVVSEFDAVLTGRIERGGLSPRLLLHDGRIAVSKDPAAPDHTLPIRVSNGGREALWVRIAEGEHVAASKELLVLAPGQSDWLEAQITGSTAYQETIQLESNDGSRTVHLRQITGTYSTGDLAPNFRLPMVNVCDESGCSTTPTCYDSSTAEHSLRPRVIAFFSSW